MAVQSAPACLPMSKCSNRNPSKSLFLDATLSGCVTLPPLSLEFQEQTGYIGGIPV